MNWMVLLFKMGIFGLLSWIRILLIFSLVRVDIMCLMVLMLVFFDLMVVFCLVFIIWLILV